MFDNYDKLSEPSLFFCFSLPFGFFVVDFSLSYFFLLVDYHSSVNLSLLYSFIIFICDCHSVSVLPHFAFLCSPSAMFRIILFGMLSQPIFSWCFISYSLFLFELFLYAYTGELGYEGPLYDGLLAMTDNMLGPSSMQIKYVSYVYDGFCIWRTNFPGPIESVISKFAWIVSFWYSEETTINAQCGRSLNHGADPANRVLNSFEGSLVLRLY